MLTSTTSCDGCPAINVSGEQVYSTTGTDRAGQLVFFVNENQSRLDDAKVVGQIVAYLVLEAISHCDGASRSNCWLSCGTTSEVRNSLGLTTLSFSTCLIIASPKVCAFATGEHVMLRLFEAQRLHGGGLRIRIKNGVDFLNDIPRNFQEITLIFQWNQGAFRPVFHDHLQGFNQRLHGFDVALDAEVAQDDEPGDRRRFLDGGVNRDHEGYASFAGNLAAEQVNGFDMEIGHIKDAGNAH